jgi:radical SAM superfamily enzyme YgiQ (UPF0313 family)
MEIIDECNRICKLYGTNELKIYFQAPTLVHNDTELSELSFFRNYYNLQFTWRASARVEFLTNQRIHELYMTGARVIDVGFESASPEILLKMNKTATPQEYLEKMAHAICEADKVGLVLKINILFYLGENIKTLQETFLFLAQYKDKIKCLSAYPLLQYPGMQQIEQYNDHFIKSNCSLIQTKEWVKRKIYPINLSNEMTFEKSNYYGILFGKAFQTLEDFFYQKQYGYNKHNVSLDKFKNYVKK